MNGMAGPQCSTIHITPEDGFSYASVEVSCQVRYPVLWQILSAACATICCALFCF